MKAGIRTKLLSQFLGVGLISVGVMAWIGFEAGSKAIERNVAESLVSQRNGKADQIRATFRQTRSQIELLSLDPTVQSAFRDFRAALAATPPEDHSAFLARYYREAFLPVVPTATRAEVEALSFIPSDKRLQNIQFQFFRAAANPSEAAGIVDPGNTAYGQVHRRFHAFFQRLAESNGFDDLYLIDPEGRVLYSLKKRPDFASELNSAGQQGQPLTEAVSLAGTGRARILDFRRYAPSGMAPAAFLSIRLPNQGTLVAQLSIEAINEVITSRRQWSNDGLGQTGEVMLVGDDNFLRSDTRLLLENKREFINTLQKIKSPASELTKIETFGTTVLQLSIDPKIVALGRQGQSIVPQTRLVSDREVLAAVAPLGVPDLDWVIIAKITRQEAYAPLQEFTQRVGIALAILIAAIVGLAYAASRSFTEPLEKISRAAQQFGAGKRGLRVDISRQDELGTLGTSLNKMFEEEERTEQIAQNIRRNIVHDLKTPLTTVKGMSETLLDHAIGNDPELRTEMIEAIVSQSDRLLEDLTDILSPVDADYVPALSQFDLSALVAKVVAYEAFTARAAQHTVRTEGLDAPLTVTADQRKIRRVIENLLSNAIKYSPGADKVVHVSLTHTESAITLRISDEGLGMTPEELELVLASGGRVVNKGHSIEGSGFGLGSVQHVVRAHGGSLIAESEKGKGSTFGFVLPQSAS